MEGDPTFSFERLAACRKYVTDCTDFFKDVEVDTKGEECCRAQKAVGAILAMTGRLDRLCTGRAVKALVDGMLDGKDYKLVLPEKYHSVGHALQINWVQEMSQLEHADLSKLAGCVTQAVCAVSFSNTDLWSEDIFEGKRRECKDFVKAFQDALTKALDQEGQAVMNPVETFLQKYSAVVQCVDEWAVKDIDWIYKAENLAEVKKDITDFLDASAAARDLSNHLSPLAKFKSQCRETQAIFEKSIELQSQLHDKGSDGRKVCVYMMFSTVVVEAGHTAADDVEATEKYTKKKFNLGREVLGEKLQGLLKGLRNKKPPDQESQSSKRKIEQSEKKAKKEKSEKKDKSEKSDKKEKDGKSKSKKHSK